MSSTGGHGTGYEDAITRRIGALEAEVGALRDRVTRADATVAELVQDNATLRRRAEADAARVRRSGLYVVLASLVALGCLAGLVLTMVRVGR